MGKRKKRKKRTPPRVRKVGPLGAILGVKRGQFRKKGKRGLVKGTLVSK